MPKNVTARSAPEQAAKREPQPAEVFARMERGETTAPPPAAPPPAEDDADTRSRLIGAAVRLLAAMNPENAEVCLSLITAIDREAGCMTPAELFIRKLGLSYQYASITPDDVRADLAEFEEDFALAAKWSQNFARQYPGLVVANA